MLKIQPGGMSAQNRRSRIIHDARLRPRGGSRATLNKHTASCRMTKPGAKTDIASGEVNHDTDVH